MLLPDATAIKRELSAVHMLYAAMVQWLNPESGMGGKLLFAGELDQAGCRFVRAANIAGAASLTATADASVARQAMRDGVVDFVVTSLDEALRILKNEIRKRQPVAVGVAVSPQDIVAEMVERGVLPDLLPPAAAQSSAAGSALAVLQAQGARRIEVLPEPSDRQFVILPIPEAWSQRSAEFDAVLLEFVPEDDHVNRRWLRLSPRYLGHPARRLRSFECDAETASKLADRVK
jgi:hypothetical protein